MAITPSYQAPCQTPPIVIEHNFLFGDAGNEFTDNIQLKDWAKKGLIDSVNQAGEWHYLIYVPVRAVWQVSIQPDTTFINDSTFTVDYKYFDSAILQLPDNIIKEDLIVYDYETEEAIIPDTLWVEKWTFSKKNIEKLDPIVKNNNNDFIYHNLSPGFKPAKHKSDLDDKAKTEKQKKDKLKKKVK